MSTIKKTTIKRKLKTVAKNRVTQKRRVLRDFSYEVTIRDLC